jgi:hypothetical protein
VLVGVMKVVKLNTQPTLDDALSVLESLTNDVKSGAVIAFFAAALDDKDVTIAYVSSTKAVTRLRLQGAMSQALHDMQRGESI